MKLFNAIGTLAAAMMLLPAQTMAGQYKGFSMGANKADGGCKTQTDWRIDFQTIKGWGKGFNAARLYASSDCNTIMRAAAAARSTGFKILVGVWATDDGHFNAEKQALEAAIRTHGWDWIAAVSVGSEDLYRKDISPQKLAGQIYDVRGMVRSLTRNANIPVGHTDTWTAWVDGANDVVTRASDVVITNGFPYWQGVPIRDTLKSKTFQWSYWDTKRRVEQINPKALVWVGETGWPTGGPNYPNPAGGGAAPATTNLRNYYNEVGCWLWAKPDVSAFWFTAFDAPKANPEVEKWFGIADSNRKLKFALPC
ncbi:hypothetical protein TWF569_009025 [Orbilia oligospora]|uniref:Probable glucan endo-1,3-beta-glucosidase eglC n=3 Tax=Orbilia oligospora TaxID=2813651 RepID=G1XNG5_ARTOA|nr:hypothetical protein AOL_s00170g18 [Orbilia oligospora ATCC 24927]KAF3092591.1 hypothetical protein TWF102_008408 [Orbilia oligospora]EGX45311.1 hypothetical protein AOL_s00170g18 [Orbilia oligospora ATCC 24927]KAF3096325.1 hypothetical protein TWF103_009893 [Orbilia oligospora]KAF3098005.1 hypothetical protein TWF706_006944 [Orbilia oligospora]KAF3124822.1 hypothetical protein TWF703_011181 [Orbilia oligospora]